MLDVLLLLAILWFVKDILGAISENLVHIKAAWIPIVMLLGAAIAATYAVTSRIDKGAKDAVDERLKLRDEQLADLKAKVGTDVPSEIKKRIDSLQDEVLSLKPPRLASNVAARLSEMLKAAPGAIYIARDMAVPSVNAFSEELWRAFANAGWAVARGTVLGSPISPPTGVGITIPDPSSPSTKQALILKAFNEVGIRFDIRRDPTSTVVTEGRGDAEILLTGRSN